MKKTICIPPADETIERWLRAVKLINDFKLLGYVTRGDFVAIIGEYNEVYKSDYTMIQRLNNFWAMREKSPALFKDIETVLNANPPCKKQL